MPSILVLGIFILKRWRFPINYSIIRLILSTLFFSLLFSACNKPNATTLILENFELELPNCYEIIDDGNVKNEFDLNPHTIFELQF